MSVKLFELAFVIALAVLNILVFELGIKDMFKVDNTSPKSLTGISEKDYDDPKQEWKKPMALMPWLRAGIDIQLQQVTKYLSRSENYFATTTAAVSETTLAVEYFKKNYASLEDESPIVFVNAVKPTEEEAREAEEDRQQQRNEKAVPNNSKGTSSSSSGGSKVAKPLPPERQMEPVLFVHVGKAGGSSLRNAIKQASRTCQRQNGGGNLSTTILPATTKTPYHCSMARMAGEDRLVHIWNNHDAFPNFSQFLVTVRNPIDRLVSWFNFERIGVLAPRKREQSQKSYPIATTLHTCFRTLNEVVGAVLLNQTTTTGGGVVMSPHFYNHSEACTVAGRKCLLGQKMCAHHNYFNYEYYLENLVQWKTCQQQQQQQQQEQQPILNNCTARDIRIDVLRAEQDPKADLERILELWTGVPRSNLTRGISYGHANSHSAVEAKLKFKENRTTTESLMTTANTTIEDPTKYISPEGVLALCKAICPELLVYKSTLALADNLNTSDVRKSYEDLDATCRTSVDALCGTKFRFHNIKKKAWAGPILKNK